MNILLGRIVAAHGIRGAVKILSFTTDPKAIAAYGSLQLADGRTIDILRMKVASDGFIADLKDIKDRNAAEALKGQDLFVAREKLPAPDESEFYLVDLIGRDVMHGENRIGLVASIENYGAGDLIELDTGVLIPVAFISNTANSIMVDLPEGYLDPPAREDQHH